MFALGDYILYGTSGVCSVDEITTSPFDKNDARTYYLLRPLFTPGNPTIYTPIDNALVKMRPLMSETQARELLRSLPTLRPLTVDAEKKRRDTYRESLASQDPYVLAGLIKAVLVRRRECISGHKRLPDMDNEYDLLAKKSLFAELSVLLDIPFAEIEGHLPGLYDIPEDASEE